ncbi:MAG: HisA/HisF-related TIM barrel protein [Crocinitomicaceae bacterium]|jgi:cyclase
MLRTRVIPIIQICNRALVKTVKYKKPKYLGDPLNAIKIFNEKRVDELLIIDIHAAKRKSKIDFEYIEELCAECFMPIGYGGGIESLEDIKRLFTLGVEKIIVNTLVYTNPALIENAIKLYGAQSIVASVDINKHWLTKKIVPYIKSSTQKINMELNAYIQYCLKLGVGEIIFNTIEREGTFKGYDLDLINKYIQDLNIPTVINGGANNFQNLIAAKKAGADALASGSFFSLQLPHLAVLITYLSKQEINEINSEN